MSVLLTSAFSILTPQEILSSLYLRLILQMGTQNAVCLPELDFLRTLAFGTANITWTWYCSELEAQDDTALQTNQGCSHCEMTETSSPRSLQALCLPLPLPSSLTATEKTHNYFWDIVSALISAACRTQSKEPPLPSVSRAACWGQGRGPGHQIVPCESEHQETAALCPWTQTPLFL